MRELIYLILGIVVFILLIPVIGFLAQVLLIVVAIAVVVRVIALIISYYRFKNDPRFKDQNFDFYNTKNNNPDIIDVDYTEKEEKDSHDNDHSGH